MLSVRNIHRRYNYNVEDDYEDDFTGFSDDSETLSDDGAIPAPISYKPSNIPSRQIVDREFTYGEGCETNSGAHIKVSIIHTKIKLFNHYRVI